MSKNRNNFYNRIYFKTWIYFFVFSVAIISLVAIFQIYLFEPEYMKLEENLLSSIGSSVITINNNEEYSIYDKNYNFELTAIKNKVCILILNNDNELHYLVDGTEENSSKLYIIEENKDKKLDIIYINTLFSRKNATFVTVEGRSNEYDHLIYRCYDDNYIYYIDTTLQSMNTILKITQMQLMNLMICIFILSFVISIIFARVLSKPIEDITNEAKKLASGNFDVNMKHSNIHELNELVDTIDIAANELGELDNIKTEIVQNVAHDIRTPLTMIKAYAELVRDYSFKDEIKCKEHLGIIIDETDNLSDFVGKILNLSKLEKGISKPVMEAFDLSTLVYNIVDRINISIANEGIKVISNCEPELIAVGDQTNIREVLNNFISNAINHVGNDNKVYLNAYLKDSKTIYIEIFDHGDGISPDIMPKIWDRYIKANKQYQRSNQSHGLGLAINKAILEAHNSTYGVESVVGEGAKFYFTLQAKEIN